MGVPGCPPKNSDFNGSIHRLGRVLLSRRRTSRAASRLRRRPWASAVAGPHERPVRVPPWRWPPAAALPRSRPDPLRPPRLWRRKPHGWWLRAVEARDVPGPGRDRRDCRPGCVRHRRRRNAGQHGELDPARGPLGVIEPLERGIKEPRARHAGVWLPIGGYSQPGTGRRCSDHPGASALRDDAHQPACSAGALARLPADHRHA